MTASRRKGSGLPGKELTTSAQTSTAAGSGLLAIRPAGCGVAGLLALPVLWAKLPESETYPQAVADKKSGTSSIAAVRSSDVVRCRCLRVSIGLRVASFMGLLLVLRPQHLAADDRG